MSGWRERYEFSFGQTYFLFTSINKLKEMLPETYESLDVSARILPDNSDTVCAPFIGLVINLNVATAAHRDSKDDGVCLVLAIGDYDGGELVLYEPGLVVPLAHGDFTIFPSCKLTHFNLHYKGRRASIVLHTDREIIKWCTDRNGWSNNRSFI